LAVLVLKQLQSLIPAAWYCEVAASSQVETYSTCKSIMIPSTGVGGGGAGVQPHPQNFDLVKIRAKSHKIGQNPLKSGENLREPFKTL